MPKPLLEWLPPQLVTHDKRSGYGFAAEAQNDEEPKQLEQQQELQEEAPMKEEQEKVTEEFLPQPHLYIWTPDTNFTKFTHKLEA